MCDSIRSKSSGVMAALFLGWLFAFVSPLWAQDDDVPKSTTPVSVLIVTGEDYPGHKWNETTPVLKEQLTQDRTLDVDVDEDSRILASPTLHDYDVVVLHFKNYDPQKPGRKAFDNMKKYVENGGGLVLVHFACGAFEEFKEDYEKIAGRVWMGLEHDFKDRHQHDPYGPFTVDIVDNDHPITKGMTSFKTKDELYTCLEGTSDITVLATSVSKVDGKTYPIAFVVECGKGRVFHCVLGHDAASLKGKDVGDLFRSACVWVGSSPE